MTTVADITARLERLPPRTVWTLVVILSLGGCFEFYDFMMTAYIAPGLVKAGIFHTGKAGLFGLADQASFAAATFLGLFVGTIAVSPVADRFGRRAIFTASLLWYTAATLAMACQSTALGIDLWRLVAGVGIGVELVTIDTYIAELVPGAIRGKAFAVNQAIQFLAVPAVALACWLLVPWTILGLAGWRWVMLLGAAAAVGVWIIRSHLPESPRWLAGRGRMDEADAVLARLEARGPLSAAPILAPAPAAANDAAEDPAEIERHARIGELFRPPYLGRTLLLTLFNICQTVGFFGFGNWAPTFLAAQGQGVTKSLQYSFIIAVAYPVAPLLWSLVAERAERKWLIVGACIATAGLGLAFAAARAPAILVVLGVGITFANNLMSFAYHTYQAELFPTRVRARAVGFVYSWSRLSTVLTSYVIAFLMATSGVAGVFAFIAGAMGVAAASIALFGPRTRGKSLEAIAG